MNITLMSQLNFNGKTNCKIVKKIKTSRIPGINNSTIVTDYFGMNIDKITDIDSKMMYKGKILKEKKYHNGRGFNEDRLARIEEEIQKNVKEGYHIITDTVDDFYYI